MRIRLLALSLSCMIILLPMQTKASDQESFKTEEYGASGALDLVNAADAYAHGYAGLGQTLGVLDTTLRVYYPELSANAK